MQRQDIEAKVRAILVEDFKIPNESIRPEATFRGDLRLDSLDVVDFIMLLQKDFGFKSPMDSYRQLHRYEQLIDFLVDTLSSQ